MKAIYRNASGNTIMIITHGDVILFSASGIATALGFREPHKAIRRYCKNVVCRLMQNKAMTISHEFIPADDVARLVAKSKRLSLDKFVLDLFCGEDNPIDNITIL